ncbi:ADP-ribosylglycohydrolase family protein [Magnetospira sp. QH-2]|uniref:ADP-ribosylglycohydrolase family protein n=1 Tax=Magnetospira sp. (strain QH-2) TaxID=1288970 RepID=UPI0003E81C0F|nr:ADP-ribosylglycohydrolase family protein [Magnetospira sp. QH-2]CCQ73443.1 ADP-ribosylglycohydrolase [Magnetospira sp. QH-2]
MLGAIAGDMIGSIYEYADPPPDGFPLFKKESTYTDDTVMTIAVADWLLSGGTVGPCLRRWARRYPDAGYGDRFQTWAQADEAPPLNSYGNGSAMRVSPVAWIAKTDRQCLTLARESARPSHGHPEGIKGAQAVALALWMARDGTNKKSIRARIQKKFGYDLSTSVAAIRTDYGYDVTCQGSVPQALVCALEAESYEQAVRNAVSLGGDADTLACMAGGVAECLYGLPKEVGQEVRARLDKDLARVVDRFIARYGRPTLGRRLRSLFTSS